MEMYGLLNGEIGFRLVCLIKTAVTKTRFSAWERYGEKSIDPGNNPGASQFLYHIINTHTYSVDAAFLLSCASAGDWRLVQHILTPLEWVTAGCPAAISSQFENAFEASAKNKDRRCAIRLNGLLCCR